MSMAADREALFARIMEDPEDDAPRLIFSDILEESGEPDRAEFIRLQIRESRTDPNDPALPAIRERIETLRAEHGVAWINELPQFRGVHWEIFERGFISTARIEKPDAFFEHSTDIFRSTPVSRLRLEQFFSDDFVRIANMAVLGLVRELDLEGGCRLGNAGIEALVENDRLKSITSIRAPGNNLGPAALRILATAPFAPRLATLDVSRNDIYDDGAQALTEGDAPGFAGLKHLSLSNCRLSARGVNSLFSRPVMPGLETLMIGGNPLGGEQTLLDHPGSPDAFRHLRSLLVERCGLTDASIADFARGAALPSLEWLYLRQNSLTQATARLFLGPGRLPKIRDLNFSENQLTRRQVNALKELFAPGVFAA